MSGVKAGGSSTHAKPAHVKASPGSSAKGPGGTDTRVKPDQSGPAQARRALLDRLRTTPGRVRLGVALLTIVACGLGVAIAMSFGGLNSGFTAIGNHDAQLVEESNALYFSANDMDAQVANVLLTGNNRALATDRQQDIAIYAQDRQHAEQDLQQIAVAAAADPAAQHAVSTVLNALGQYEALAADAILVNQRGNDPAGRPSPATLGYFQQATDLMSGTVLQAATQLTNANAGSLTTSYNQNRSAASTERLLVLGLGLLLIISLVALQVYLARRYRRLISPLLAAATVAALALTAVAAGQLTAQGNHLYVAKVDAFDSILALTQAQAVSYDGNADESRFLVDPARATQYQDSFLAKSQEIANVGDAGIFQYDAALAKDIDAYQASNANVQFNGFLGAEFRNITFPGERAAAVKTLLAYQVYERDDRVLRATAKTNLDAAITYDIGTRPDQSDGAFNNYANALSSVIAINENAFTSAIQDGHSTGSGWTGLIPAIAVIVIAGLAIAGTRRRLAEYR
jgi:CHASE3 domain sensor protein